MNPKHLVLPALSLGGAALLLAPARPSQAFSKIGGSLGETQRDVRVFDNFTDTQSDNNAIADSQFPGYLGLELAIWKGIVEWGSKLHGDGTGDPLNGNLLGDGGANFDAFWAGNASGVGTSNNNIVSAIASCPASTLAFTETPISDGWRIRFCDNWVWDDGPALIGSRWDIQGVMAHEYGHALGLGHSGIGQATMAPSGSPGQTSIRSIHADDIAGIQCVYNVASGTKPMIVATVASAGTLTIHGMNFGATGNEVWFTPSAVTATGSDPIVRVTGVSSSGGGTMISVAIPAAAGPGDVIVNGSGAGNATVSNAFPTDLVGTFGEVPGTHPELASITPSSVDALIPGTDETVTLSGTDLDVTTNVLMDGVPIDPARWTIQNATTITLDMPQAIALGQHDLGVTDGVVTDELPITIVAPATPKLQWGTGDAANVIDRDNGLDMILAGQPGAVHTVRGNRLQPPTLQKFSRPLDLSLVDGGTYVIPGAGWIQIHLDDLPDPAVVGATWFARSFDISQPKPFPSSNDQSITLVP
jgi:hypothetical protein